MCFCKRLIVQDLFINEWSCIFRFQINRIPSCPPQTTLCVYIKCLIWYWKSEIKSELSQDWSNRPDKSWRKWIVIIAIEATVNHPRQQSHVTAGNGRNLSILDNDQSVIGPGRSTSQSKWWKGSELSPEIAGDNPYIGKTGFTVLWKSLSLYTPLQKQQHVHAETPTLQLWAGGLPLWGEFSKISRSPAWVWF